MALTVSSNLPKAGTGTADLGARETCVLSIKQQMLPWKGLDLPLEDICDTVFTRVLIGTLDGRSALGFEDEINTNFSDRELFIQRVGEDREQISYIIIYHKVLEQEIDSKLKEFGFNRISFSSMEGTPAEILDYCDEQLNDIMEERQRIEEEARELGARMSELEVIYDALSILRDKEQEARKLLRTGRTFALKGWIPAADAQTFIDKLNRAVNAIYIHLEDPEPGESFPVALENPPLIQPFEVVTELYSTPDPRSIDPNPYMAPFFFIFFGIMMGDAGWNNYSCIILFCIKKAKAEGNR